MPPNVLCSKWNGKSKEWEWSRSEGNGCNINFYRHFNIEIWDPNKPWQMANNECVCPAFSQVIHTHTRRFQTNQMEIVYFMCRNFLKTKQAERFCIYSARNFRKKMRVRRIKSKEIIFWQDFKRKYQLRNQIVFTLFPTLHSHTHAHA